MKLILDNREKKLYEECNKLITGVDTFKNIVIDVQALEIGDIINIHMYSDKGAKVVFGGYAEYDAEFTLVESFWVEGMTDWNKNCSTRLSVAACITKGILADITSQVDRNFKLEQLDI